MKLSTSSVLKNVAIVAMLAVVFSNPAFAVVAANIKTMATDISTMLSGISIIVITVAFIFVGYQLAFGGKRFNDVMPIVIGAIIVGSAAQLAAMFAAPAA